MYIYLSIYLHCVIKLSLHYNSENYIIVFNIPKFSFLSSNLSVCWLIQLSLSLYDYFIANVATNSFSFSNVDSLGFIFSSALFFLFIKDFNSTVFPVAYFLSYKNSSVFYLIPPPPLTYQFCSYIPLSTLSTKADKIYKLWTRDFVA